jgi:hypothetical protein
MSTDRVTGDDGILTTDHLPSEVGIREWPPFTEEIHSEFC